jgi:hypothetical protein
MTADPVPTYRGEAVLLRWGHTSTSGFTVSFLLHDDDCAGGPPFAGFAAGKGGQRFALVAVPIGDDERPAAEETSTNPRPDPAPVPPPGRPPVRYAELPPSQQVALRLRDWTFVGWLLPVEERGPLRENDRDYALAELKRRLRIDSRRELDGDTPEAMAKAEAWRRLETDFLALTGGMAEARR